MLVIAENATAARFSVAMVAKTWQSPLAAPSAKTP